MRCDQNHIDLFHCGNLLTFISFLHRLLVFAFGPVFVAAFVFPSSRLRRSLLAIYLPSSPSPLLPSPPSSPLNIVVSFTPSTSPSSPTYSQLPSSQLCQIDALQVALPPKIVPFESHPLDRQAPLNRPSSLSPSMLMLSARAWNEDLEAWLMCQLSAKVSIWRRDAARWLTSARDSI